MVTEFIPNTLTPEDSEHMMRTSLQRNFAARYTDAPVGRVLRSHARDPTVRANKFDAEMSEPWVEWFMSCYRMNHLFRGPCGPKRESVTQQRIVELFGEVGTVADGAMRRFVNRVPPEGRVKNALYYGVQLPDGSRMYFRTF